MSSSYGQFDLAGFPKAPAAWFRAKWLANVSAADAGRPPLAQPAALAAVRIVDTWRAAAAAGKNRSIHVYSSAPARTKLSVDGGAPLGAPAQLAGGVATWSVPFAPGSTLRARALAADGATVLAEHARAAWGAPAALQLTLDAPSPASGTGRGALYLDGADVALLRAAVVDAAGALCADAAPNVTFAVAAGPGLVVGCGSGDPADRAPNGAPWKPAYHGLVRAIVRGTVDAAGPAAARALRASIDVDAGAGPRASGYLPDGQAPPTEIVVTASAPGLRAAQLRIPLSVDWADSVWAAAAAGVGSADFGE